MYKPSNPSGGRTSFRLSVDATQRIASTLCSQRFRFLRGKHTDCGITSSPSVIHITRPTVLFEVAACGSFKAALHGILVIRQQARAALDTPILFI
jgi:hypothetical protein